MHHILYTLKPLASETMLFLCVIVSESWGNDIRRWFNLPPWTFVHGQAGSDDETWKEFLLGGEACTPVNTDSLKLSLDCLTLSTLFLPPSTIDSWQSGLIYSHDIMQSGKHCRCDGLRLKVWHLQSISQKVVGWVRGDSIACGASSSDLHKVNSEGWARQELSYTVY